MHFKAFYDAEFKHIGFLPDDENRALSDRFIRVTEAQWLDLLTETNQIIYDSIAPSDLTKIKIQVKTPGPPPWAAEEKLKSEKKAKKDKAMETLAQIQAATLPTAQLLKVKALFPEWAAGMVVSKVLMPYIQYGDKLYLVNQDHTTQADWPPSTTASLYSEVTPPGSIAPWVQPLGAHDAYNKPGSGLPKSDPVTHNGKTWSSTINANVWEPGVYGWAEQI